MHGTKVGVKTQYVNGVECVTEGQRFNNTTVQRHYQVEYPKDLS